MMLDSYLGETVPSIIVLILKFRWSEVMPLKTINVDTNDMSHQHNMITKLVLHSGKARL